MQYGNWQQIFVYFLFEIIQNNVQIFCYFYNYYCYVVTLWDFNVLLFIYLIFIVGFNLGTHFQFDDKSFSKPARRVYWKHFRFLSFHLDNVCVTLFRTKACVNLYFGELYDAQVFLNKIIYGDDM